jgi:hypothetical protein
MCKNYTLKSFKTDSKELSLLFAEFKKKLKLTLFTMKNYPQSFWMWKKIYTINNTTLKIP